MMNKEESYFHLHEYERSVSNIEIYRCLHPDCSHYAKREFLVGKRAICHKCKNPFLLSKRQLKPNQKARGILHPTCSFCSKSHKTAKLTELTEILEKEVFSEAEKEKSHENI